MDSREAQLRSLTDRRWRVALTLTAAMMVIYFGFMLLVAYKKAWLGEQIVPGLSWGILLGAGVIVAAWLLTFIYVRWANVHYDHRVASIKADGQASSDTST